MKIRNTAILLFKDVEVLDFAGPFEVFNVANSACGGKFFNVYTVAEHKDMLETKNGLKVLPDYSIASCPPPDIIIIPGGDGRKVQMNNDIILHWIKDNFNRVELMISVCTGSFILGNAGLLDGLNATTHHDSYSEFEAAFPNTALIKGDKFVDSGKIITAAGVSSGINMSLHIVKKLAGEEAARKTAEIIEYNV
ncbi:MAG: DJ-1/PfpI family protein [Ignavibacteriae bacterium]|nr:MAG: DJ-1/PfpI family protein [Ignavibacteriota bacterium]